ncbi:unnamed protein product [Hydatigera taeniaeformis]|uniref:Uncharacterized protein n=1 Tax=Hydatigena taeniaeformis TaxID=6205 RepID=A0A3P7EX05_HYDTA|nr:unnamed protein product [Hydatigera taeniaeformis]
MLLQAFFPTLQIDLNQVVNRDGDSLLLQAAMHGSDRSLRIILIYGGAVNSADRYGNTALHWAAVTGNMNCVHYLLDYGIDLDTFNCTNVTPLMLALSFGHIEVANHLLYHGASTTPELNNYDESALTFALNTNNNAIVELILAAEVPPEHRIRELYVSLGQAAFSGCMATVQLLLSHGAPVDFSNALIESPLHAAIRGDNEEIVEFLLSKGANINALNPDGYTPLMEATRRRNVNAVYALINAGADIMALNDANGKTAYTLAEEGKYFEISDMLLEALNCRYL